MYIWEQDFPQILSGEGRTVSKSMDKWNIWRDSEMNQVFGAVWAGLSPVSAEIWASLP